MLTKVIKFSQKSCEETMFWRNTWWKTTVSKGILNDIYLCIVLESTKSIPLVIFFFLTGFLLLHANPAMC